MAGAPSAQAAADASAAPSSIAEATAEIALLPGDVVLLAPARPGDRAHRRDQRRADHGVVLRARAVAGVAGAELAQRRHDGVQRAQRPAQQDERLEQLALLARQVVREQAAHGTGAATNSRA